jgi:hypothetical protein
MTNRSSSLFALSAAAFTLACGGNPEPSTPEPAVAQSPAAQAPAQTSVGAPAADTTLSDERAMELARGYFDLLQAGNFAQAWEHVSPTGQARFGSLDRFQSEGQRILGELGAEVGIVSEAIEPPRAGMAASKLYMRVSRYERASGPVRMVIGLLNDGSIIGINVGPAQ